jgi:hypothetical protein
VSYAPGGNAQVRRSRRALSAGQPGRFGISRRAASLARITCGCARTMYSGLSFGNAPIDAGTMLPMPTRASTSPTNEPAPAACGADDTSK